ncbi:MAG: hypothetical protein HS111_28600 [Kofleriaceae bacterium]|nr:hypothetical protein [Kofleriaceae bacterium]
MPARQEAIVAGVVGDAGAQGGEAAVAGPGGGQAAGERGGGGGGVRIIEGDADPLGAVAHVDPGRAVEAVTDGERAAVGLAREAGVLATGRVQLGAEVEAGAEDVGDLVAEVETVTQRRELGGEREALAGAEQIDLDDAGVEDEPLVGRVAGAQLEPAGRSARPGPGRLGVGAGVGVEPRRGQRRRQEVVGVGRGRGEHGGERQGASHAGCDRRRAAAVASAEGSGRLKDLQGAARVTARAAGRGAGLQRDDRGHARCNPASACPRPRLARCPAGSCSPRCSAAAARPAGSRPARRS